MPVSSFLSPRDKCAGKRSHATSLSLNIRSLAGKYKTAHLKQGEVGYNVGIQLFHVVDHFNQVNISLAQLVANEVVLSVAL